MKRKSLSLGYAKELFTGALPCKLRSSFPEDFPAFVSIIKDPKTKSDDMDNLYDIHGSSFWEAPPRPASPIGRSWPLHFPYTGFCLKLFEHNSESQR